MLDIVDREAELAALAKFDIRKPSPSFISEAVFPNFKNLEIGTRVSFTYPITALVGANGTGKSSVLHALWGMPQGHSTSRFWFSTNIDSIKFDDEAGIPRYWYVHWVQELKRYVESKKVFGKKRLGYWEPARALKSDGMQPVPTMTEDDKPFRSQDRWDATNRKVIYLNFKCELSAFDRFFYFDDGRSLQSKQEIYARGAEKLSRVLSWRLRSYSPGGKQAVFENRELTETELKWVSFILGRDYSSARYVRHRLLTGSESPTVLFTRKDITYSEAAAGSGELAVTRAVIQLLKAEPATLVLLDEPETSLHPGAQAALMDFLFVQVRTKRLQIVMSTHSPTLVEMLPSKAIKVLEETPEGKSRITSVSHPAMAFNRLGYMSGDTVTVAVEDDLLKNLVELALAQLDAGERDLIKLYVPPGGATSILTHEIPVWINGGDSFFTILDGDQTPTEELEDVVDMSERQLGILPSRILNIYKIRPDHVQGNIDAAKKYWMWTKKRIRYLKDICPEAVLLKQLVGEQKGASLATTNQNAKTSFIAAMEDANHKTNASGLAAAVSFLLPNRGKGNAVIECLVNDLRDFVAMHEASRAV